MQLLAFFMMKCSKHYNQRIKGQSNQSNKDLSLLQACQRLSYLYMKTVLSNDYN